MQLHAWILSPSMSAAGPEPPPKKNPAPICLPDLLACAQTHTEMLRHTQEQTCASARTDRSSTAESAHRSRACFLANQSFSEEQLSFSEFAAGRTTAKTFRTENVMFKQSLISQYQQIEKGFAD